MDKQYGINYDPKTWPATDIMPIQTDNGAQNARQVTYGKMPDGDDMTMYMRAAIYDGLLRGDNIVAPGFGWELVITDKTGEVIQPVAPGYCY